MYQRQIPIQQMSIRIKQQRQMFASSQKKGKTIKQVYMEAALPTKEGILQVLDDVFKNVHCGDVKLYDKWRNKVVDILKQDNWRSLLKENVCLIKRELLQKSEAYRKDCLKKFISSVKLLIQNNSQCLINQLQIGAHESNLNRTSTAIYPIQANSARLKTQHYQTPERKSSNLIKKSNIIQNPQFQPFNWNTSRGYQVYCDKKIFEPTNTGENENLAHQIQRLTKKNHQLSEDNQVLKQRLKSLISILQQKEKRQIGNQDSSKKKEKLNEHKNQEETKNQMPQCLNFGHLKKQFSTYNTLGNSKKTHQQHFRELRARKAAQTFSWQEQSI